MHATFEQDFDQLEQTFIRALGNKMIDFKVKL